MVLFIEDEKRIKAMERAEKLAKRSRLGVLMRRLFKIFLVLALLFGVSLLLLSGIKGNSESLKKGAEDYLSQATGLRATIGAFGTMRFFPDLVFEAGDIAFYKGDAPGTPVMSVEKAQFAAGFFSMMFSRDRFKTLYIGNLRAEAGLLGPDTLVIDTLGLTGGGLAPQMGGPGIEFKGRYGAAAIEGFLSMAAEKDAYALPREADFTLRLGALDTAGRLVRNPWRGLKAAIAAQGFEKEGIVKTVFEDSGIAKDPAQIKCAIGSFKIEDGTAHAESLFLDTGNGLVSGTGSFVFRAMKAAFKTDGEKAGTAPGFALPLLPETHACHAYLAAPAQKAAP